MLNGWKINVNKSGMPEKVATAFGKLSETLIGAEYEFIAYLGEQMANGVNHAVLARQILTTGRDTVNVVLMIFNERPGEMTATLANIERVVEGGLPFGGVKVCDEDPIPEDAASAWESAFSRFVGAKLEAFALLGTQVVNGINYIFAATSQAVVPDAEKKIALVVVNPSIGSVAIGNLLGNKHEAALGYSFTWLKGGLGKPLGEWP